VDLACTLMGMPEVVMLDEPTTGLDPESRRRVWRLIRDLRDEGATVLLTTHYLEEAQALADQVAIVKDGRIVAEGPPSEVGTGRSRYRVSYMSNGSRVELETDDPTELLHRLTAEALERGDRLENLSVSRPTLEDVYLDLTAEEESAAVTPEAVSP
jgi:ABC-2 type transport system ATP-binding protein